jgi:hypothetical protein
MASLSLSDELFDRTPTGSISNSQSILLGPPFIKVLVLMVMDPLFLFVTFVSFLLLLLTSSNLFTGFILRSNCIFLSKFTHSEWNIFNAYHPPPSPTVKSRVSEPFSIFLQDCNEYFSIPATIPHEICYSRL